MQNQQPALQKQSSKEQMMQQVRIINESLVNMLKNTQNTIEFCSTKTIEDICNKRYIVAKTSNIPYNNPLLPQYFYKNNTTDMKPSNLSEENITQICKMAIMDELMLQCRPSNTQRRALEMLINKNDDSLRMFVSMLLDENKAAWRFLRNVLIGGSKYNNYEKGYYNCRTIQLYHSWWMRLQYGTRLKVEPYILTITLTNSEVNLMESWLKKLLEEQQISDPQSKKYIQDLHHAIYQCDQIQDRNYLFLWCENIKMNIVTEDIKKKLENKMGPTEYSMICNNTIPVILPQQLLASFNPDTGIEHKKCYALNMKSGYFTVFQQQLIGDSTYSPHVGTVDVTLQKKQTQSVQYSSITHTNVVFTKDVIKAKMKDIKKLQDDLQYYVSRQQIYTKGLVAQIDKLVPQNNLLFKQDLKQYSQEFTVNPKYSNASILKLMKAGKWSFLKNQFDEILYTKKDNTEKGGISWDQTAQYDKLSFNFLMLPLKTSSFGRWFLLDFQFVFQHIKPMEEAYLIRKKFPMRELIPSFNEYVKTYILQVASNAYMSCKLKLGARAQKKGSKTQTSSKSQKLPYKQYMQSQQQQSQHNIEDEKQIQQIDENIMM